ncbi:MAG: tetratricopeptide repeat protein [Planctomycetota bacterium]
MALEPDNARFLNDRALILFYHLNRDLDKAEGDFKHAIALGRKEFADTKDEVKKDDAFTAFTDALVNLARLYHKQNRTAECRATLEELLKDEPGRQEGIELRAQLEDEAAALPQKGE